MAGCVDILIYKWALYLYSQKPSPIVHIQASLRGKQSGVYFSHEAVAQCPTRRAWYHPHGLHIVYTY